jgi:hypothetical protein
LIVGCDRLSSNRCGRGNRGSGQQSARWCRFYRNGNRSVSRRVDDKSGRIRGSRISTVEVAAEGPVTVELVVGELVTGNIVVGAFVTEKSVAGASVVGVSLVGAPVAREPVEGEPVAGESVAVGSPVGKVRTWGD